MWMAKAIGWVLTIAYPVLVFLSLVVFHLPLRIIALAMLVLALAFFAVSGRKKGPFPFAMALLAIIVLATHSEAVLKFYPVLINAGMLTLFAISLAKKDPIIFRFAKLGNKRVATHPARGAIRRYCICVTWVWICFFIGNGSIALYTIAAKDTTLWALYNGLISYLIMGILFGGEAIMRHIVNHNLEKTILLSELRSSSRPLDYIICYSGAYEEGRYLTWKEFLVGVAKVRSFIKDHDAKRYILHSDDFWYFDIVYAAVLSEGKEVALSANISPEFLKEIETDDTILLSDESAYNAYLISDILKCDAEGLSLEFPPIAADSDMYLYTSGSTGTPKAIHHSLHEMELDNDFVIGQWGKEFKGRVIASSVNPHHIFGFLFAALRPLAMGMPFRRERVNTPEVFKSLTHERLLIISTPAFLKRCTQDPDLAGLTLHDPMIITSGGALTPDVAAATEKTLGYWPIELYGSTETSGIAWRISNVDQSWKPFTGVQILGDEDGCLVIKSPYMSEGVFITNDLVRMETNGSFTLLGRKDSIVKIEEKRISLTEMQSRLKQTGLVSDTAVIALEDKRQYLAAAICLSEEGKARTKDMNHAQKVKLFRTEMAQYFENTVIPRKWRFVDQIPEDSMGKRPKEGIAKLFLREDGFSSVSILSSEETAKGMWNFTLIIPSGSAYFSEHFPAMRLLPAVAEIDIIAHLLKTYIHKDFTLQEIVQSKFSSPIIPDEKIQLSLKVEDDKGIVRFTYKGKGITASSGVLKGVLC